MENAIHADEDSEYKYVLGIKNGIILKCVIFLPLTKKPRKNFRFIKIRNKPVVGSDVVLKPRSVQFLFIIDPPPPPSALRRAPFEVEMHCGGRTFSISVRVRNIKTSIIMSVRRRRAVRHR